MAKDFELIEHTADVGIMAYGADVREAFANAARGMFSLIVELGSIGEVEHRYIEVTASDEESLLAAWLNELICLFDAENMLFSRFEITEFGDTFLRAKAYGEPVDSSRHQLKVGIKAATYHMLEVDRSDGGRVQVLFDI
ncbi:MAG: archease [Dehalococcoidales bacterium]|nr:MAG: archease [Dehalococcoidales bacterium]